MDAKSLAKSKRAHTQHHNKKHHSKQKPKASPSVSVGPTTSQNKTGNQQLKVISQGSNALPSNWDRYEEEYDTDSENNPSQDSSSRVTDTILPKSKGADYAYLIAEAKSQPQTNYSVKSFPSFDDVLTG